MSTLPLSAGRASLLSLLLAAACGPSMATDPVLDATTAAPSLRRAAAQGATGGVYTLTNGASGNAVLALRRAADGTLTALGAFPTGGVGTGGTIDPLVSQFALVLSDDARRLYAVNAGSDDVTAFDVEANGALTLADRVPSGGDLPVSLATHGTLLYVLNAGSNTLQGYRAAGRSGRLVAIRGSARPLSPGASGAAAVRFTRDGAYLVVTERTANRIETFPVLPNGRLGEPTLTTSNGAVPFGFDVTPRGQLVVSEAGGAGAGSAASSYAVGRGGALRLVTGSLLTDGRAACWTIVTADGRYAFVANAGTATLTPFAVDSTGRLARLATPTSTGAGTTPLDLALGAGDRFAYVLLAGTGDVAAYAVGADGALTALGATHAGAAAGGLQGMAAF